MFSKRKISIKNLTVSYSDGTCAPYDFSCVFPNGSLNNLKMKSGGGKTAVLKLMSGLFDVKNSKISGSILYNGEEVLSTGFNKKKLYRDVLFIPSFPEDAFFCADLQGEFDSFGIGSEESKSAVERFGFSHEILKRDPLTLSGGQMLIEFQLLSEPVFKFILEELSVEVWIC